MLIDLWAKKDKPGSTYNDITWCGFLGTAVPEKYVKVFNVVRDARDAAVRLLESSFAAGKTVRGCDVDDAARKVIADAGYGEYFIHRTGHSITEETHGNGVNIDNLETRDDRALLPGCCFSIEPGIYLAGSMAVRTEINIFIKHDGTPEVTGRVQSDIVLL